MIWVYLVIMVIAAILAGIRGVLGPTAPDRIIALDNLTTTTTAALVLLAYIFQRYIYIDVSLIYGVLSFIGVLTLARYLEGGL